MDRKKTQAADLANQARHQAQKLAHLNASQEDETTGSTQAAQAVFITPLDPVVETENGKRLPVVPVREAAKLNKLKDLAQGKEPREPPESALREGKDGSRYGALRSGTEADGKQSEEADAPLRQSIPNSRTNPLFPDLPVYGPPTALRTVQCWFFRATSSVLSFCFLLVIVFGALGAGISKFFHPTHGSSHQRPFQEEESKRQQDRRVAEKAWLQQKDGRATPSGEKGLPHHANFTPTEGGPDPLCTDIAHYARRVGLDAVSCDVETEDGFVIELWHIVNPRREDGEEQYPILMIHGLLQSAGAFCCNDDESLAFSLAKSGYDVWLGNNRCGFNPRHTALEYADPRMWAWNIRQMGVMDLPAFVNHILSVTGFPKLALIAHSQGTTQTFVALAKEQRPELGKKISVFCALAPAVYAGPLIGKAYFRFMRLITPGMFRMVFGIHSFIPIMMFAHTILPRRWFGWMGYHVFSFLFSWSDSRWDRGLRNRMFQFAPVYVSAESMRWWLGRECFAKHGCILSTREEGGIEDEEDEEEDEAMSGPEEEEHVSEDQRRRIRQELRHGGEDVGRFAWYNEQFPPLALWVCGADDLVDGRRLLRRLDRGREPHVDVVHQKLIKGYEHLDVIWAVDAIDKVGKELREVIWRTADAESRERCQTPIGCEEKEPDLSHEAEGKKDNAREGLHVESSKDAGEDQVKYEESRAEEARECVEADEGREVQKEAPQSEEELLTTHDE